MPITAVIRKDEAGFPSIAVVTDGRKKLTVTYDSEKGFKIEGSKRSFTPELLNALRLIYPVANLKLTSVENISYLQAGEVAASNPIRNPFFRDGLNEWKISTGQELTVTIEDDIYFGKRVKLAFIAGYIYQLLYADTNKFPFLVFWAFMPAVGGVDLRYKVTYARGASDTQADLVLPQSWACHCIALKANEIVKSVEFSSSAGIAYLAFPHLVQTNVSIPRAYGKTSIVKANTWISNTSATLHTVTAAKTFYLTGGFLSSSIIAASKTGSGYLEVDTAGDGTFRVLRQFGHNTSALIDVTHSTCPLTLSVPMPFAAATVFRIRSDNTGIFVCGGISGWEE